MLQYVMAQLNARRGEEGQGLVEYALILFLVAIGVITILTTLGDQVEEVFNQISAAL